MMPFDYTAHAFFVAVELVVFFGLIALGLAVDAYNSRKRGMVSVVQRASSRVMHARPTMAAWRRAVRRQTLAGRRSVCGVA